MFDRDAHACFDLAASETSAPGDVSGVQAGISVPCIELWGILLHTDQTAYIERAAAQRLLSKLHRDFDHDSNPYFNVDDVLRGISDARRRAGALAKLADEAEDRYRNPSTTFPALLDSVFGTALEA